MNLDVWYYTLVKTLPYYMMKVVPHMADERESFQPKQVKTVFVGDENLPTHYVNIVNARTTSEEFFLTLGTAVPLEITDSKQLDEIESINAHPLFRCAVPRSVMKQVIDLLTNLYENQTRQIELLQASQRKGEDYGDSSSEPSESL